MAHGDAGIFAGFVFSKVPCTAGEKLGGLAFGGILQVVGVFLIPFEGTTFTEDAEAESVEVGTGHLRAP